VTAKGRVLRTVVRDCLYLNWAFPVERLPDLPAPLRYEEHPYGGNSFAFGSALLFRHEHLHLAGLPFLRFSYPQFHLRFYVRDHEGVPAVYFRSILVPGWVVPSARWVAHQPAMSANFRYPQPSSDLAEEEWRWEVIRDRPLRLTARMSSPRTASGPALGNWETTVDYFRARSRGYVFAEGSLHPVETTQRPVPLWPLRVTLEDTRLLDECMAPADDLDFSQVHSAWLCPEVPYRFELDADSLRESLHRRPAPVAADPALFRHATSSSSRAAA
jgi:hypothetical protein